MFQTNSRGFDQNVDFINKLNVEHYGWQTVAHKEGESLTKHYNIQEWDNKYEEKMDKDEDLTNTSADSTTHSGYHH